MEQTYLGVSLSFFSCFAVWNILAVLGFYSVLEKGSTLEIYAGLQEFDAYENFFGHANAHDAAHDSFFGVYVD